MSKILNRNALKKLRALNRSNSKDLAVELIEDFLVKTPLFLLDIEQSLKRRDTTAVFNVAHALKSSSAVIGAESFSQIAESLETATRLGILSKTIENYVQLLQNFELTRKVLVQAATAHENMSR